MCDGRSRTAGLLTGLLLLALAAALVFTVAFLAGVRILMTPQLSGGQWFFAVVLPLAALAALTIPGGLLVWWSGRYRVPPAMARLDQLMGRTPVNTTSDAPGRVERAPVNRRYKPGRDDGYAPVLKLPPPSPAPPPPPKPTGSELPGHERPPVMRAQRRLPWQQ